MTSPISHSMIQQLFRWIVEKKKFVYSSLDYVVVGMTREQYDKYEKIQSQTPQVIVFEEMNDLDERVFEGLSKMLNR